MHHAAKTMTYFCTHMTVAFLISWAVSRNLQVALSISMLEPAFQTFAYYLHEKIWNKFKHDAPPPKKMCC